MTINFEQLVIEKTDLLHRVAFSLTRNRENAEDLVQDTLLLAFKNKHKFAPGTQLGGWLYTILRNSFINKYRKQKVRQDLNRQTYASTIETIAPDCSDSMLMATHIQQKIAELPAAFRTALEMRIEGYQYAEIADASNEPIGTIKSRIHLAKRMLREKLGGTYHLS